MNIGEVNQVARALGIVLPRHYIELITNYPIELVATDAPDFGLMDDPAALIEENLAVMGQSFYGGTWPKNLLIIGTNGCGDLYVTKLDGTEFSVGFFDHEVPAFFPHSNSREEFVSKLLQECNDAGT